MSRFFRQADDSETESEDSEEELMSSGEEDVPSSKPVASAAKPAMSRFLRKTDGDSSSDSDSDSDNGDDLDGSSSDGGESDTRPKVSIKSGKDKRLDEMESAGKAMENALKINDWVAISNEFDKLARMVARQSNVSEPIPPFFIRSLSGLENALNNAFVKEKEAKKKMNATNAKALTAMKQKVKKSTKEYEKEIKRFQADPEAFEQEYNALVTVDTPLKSAKKRTKDGAQQHEDGEVVDEFTTVGRGGKTMSFTADAILKQLQVIQEVRGKKSTDRAEQIKVLEKLLEVAATVYQRIRVLLALISSRFDYNSSIATHMSINLWLSAQTEVDQLLTIITSNSSYSVEEVTEDYDELIERSPETEKDGRIAVRGSVISFIDRLDDEFTKSLQHIDPHGTEYIERLKDEKALYRTICRAEVFFEKSNQEGPLSRVVMRRLEHIYSKPDTVIQALESNLAFPNSKLRITLAGCGSTSDLIHALCIYLYKSGTSLLRTRAMLSHVYHHALHNDFHTARDMLLMSHLQESIHSADITTQILYNRTVVQLGLCAFRSGLIKEAQSTLMEISTTQRVKELLAQGVHQQRYQILTPEQEKSEKQRQLPFHMHINTELLEAVFLVSSMLVEIPLLASIESEELRRKAISKPFRRLLDFADRQIFTGPPESTRDHIMQASKALQDGEWQRCRDLVQDIKIWSLMPEANLVKEMLAMRIQEQGLRTYLFTYAPHYSSLSLLLLSRTFSLPLRTVRSIISKMVWNEELSASLDQASEVVVFHRSDLSRAQQLAQSVADKVSSMVDQNEKTLDTRLVGVSNWGDRGEGNKGDKRVEQSQSERRGKSNRTTRGGRGGRGGRFAQGLGNQMPTPMLQQEP